MHSNMVKEVWFDDHGAMEARDRWKGAAIRLEELAGEVDGEGG